MERAEFKRAVEKTRILYPHIHLGIAWRFILAFEAALRANSEKPTEKQQPFGLLIRFTLNDDQITEKSERSMYAALVGHLFGARGVYKKARKRLSGVISKQRKKQIAPSYEVAANKKGQLEWKL